MLERKAIKLGVCQTCGLLGKTQWSNISGDYKYDVSDYSELCQSCHHHYDKNVLGKVYIRTKPSGFSLNHERAVSAGRKGGTISRRS